MTRHTAVLLAALVVAGCSPGRPGTAPTTTAFGAAAPSGQSSSVGALGADWPAYHHDLARSGASTDMPKPQRISVQARVELDGAMYASPLVAGGLIIAATENDSMYALDAGGREVWRTHLGDPSPQSERPCGNIDPLGITGTPVYDGGTVYAAAEYRGGRHELVAVDARTGAVLRRTALDLPGVDQLVMQQRGALTVTGDRVWVTLGGLAGDCGNYLGRVIGVPLRGSGAPVSYTVPTTREGGIWTPPGPSVDRSGSLFVSVGNGEQGSGGTYDYSDSILRLDNTSARLLDSFSPSTWRADNDADLDLGSQGPALVGERWVVIAGKSGTGYVLRQGDLGHIGGQVWSGPVCKSFGGTAVRGDIVYLPCADGIRAARISGDGALQLLWQAASDTSGSPVFGGGRVWALSPASGTLHVLDPATGRSVLHLAVGPVTRFATPALSGQLVIVPTVTGLTIVSVEV